MPYKDILDRRAAGRRWYRNNSDKQIAQVKKRRLTLRQGLQEYKKTLSCVDCGETHTECLEFHHVDPKTKEGDPSRMYSSRGWSLPRLIEYLMKTCIVLCANCHRKHHARERLAKKARHTAGKKTRKESSSII